MKKILFIFFTMFISVPAFPQDIYTHCKTDEIPIISCNVGSKFFGLCASKNLSQNTGYLQYRFGKKNKIEFTYPGKKIHPKGNFVYSSLMLFGGGGDYVKFSNGNIQYVVYSYIRNQEDSAGVAVYKNNKLLKDFKCQTWLLGNNWSPVYKAELTEDKSEFETPW